jgi:hypothetical protein
MSTGHGSRAPTPSSGAPTPTSRVATPSSDAPTSSAARDAASSDVATGEQGIDDVIEIDDSVEVGDKKKLKSAVWQDFTKVRVVGI